MGNFNVFLRKVLRLEGGYVNHKNDRGGCTNKGVTLNTFRSYYGSGLDCNDLKAITEDQAGEIYKKGYWDPCWGDKIQCSKVAQIIVDWAVNSGVKTAIKNVQKIVGTTADGVMGPMTLRAINENCQKDLFDAIKDARKAYYERLVEKDESQRVFLKGWLNRLDEYEWCDDC
jgi:lysozyme family protein